MTQHRETVVILGGTSGIGLAAAQVLSTGGFQVVVAGRDSARAAQAHKENPAIRAEIADASSAEALNRLYRLLGTFDHLVISVSGGKGAGPFASLALHDLRSGFEMKFFPQVLAAQLALPHLRKDGSITFVSAISARAANPGTAGLAAINGAIEAMIKPLARELRPLRINAVSPGVIQTPWWDRLEPEIREQLLNQAASATLVGRNGHAKEVGQSIAYIVTNGFVTGTVLEVDGGLRLS